MAYVNGHEDFMIALTLGDGSDGSGSAMLCEVLIPAAGSEDLGDWHEGGVSGSYYMQNTFTDAPANCAVFQTCTDPSAFTDHGLRVEFYNGDWELWVDSLPETACTLTLLFVPHDTLDAPCIFPALWTTTSGAAAAASRYTVEIPAAGGSTGDWYQAAAESTEHYNQQALHNAPKGSVVLPSCTDPTVFTDHGFRIEYEEQLDGWVLWIDTLPENACTLTLVFIPCGNESEPCVLPALGVGGGDTTELEQQIAANAGAIVALDKRVEGAEDSIRDLYGKLPSGGSGGVYLDVTFEGELNEGRYEYDYGIMLDNELVLTSGTKYKVVYDGTEYECECTSIGSNQYLGNGGMIGYEDTGEPFLVWLSSDFIFVTEAGEHTLKICDVEKSALPPVTEADNGKFLRVVDGAYALVNLQDVSKEGL